MMAPTVANTRSLRAPADLARGGQVLASNATAAVTSESSAAKRFSHRDSGPCASTASIIPSACTSSCTPISTHALSLRGAADRGLPRWPTSLVGREREIAEVRALLENAAS
jgi:hypothetical protein